jgi:hypothetical protein
MLYIVQQIITASVTRQVHVRKIDREEISARRALEKLPIRKRRKK